MAISIGLTGGIATGKSLISQILAQFGAYIIDSDKAAHEMYLPQGRLWRNVVEAFGKEVLLPDENIDRRRLGEIVFKDPQALKRLNAATHPQIIQWAKEEIGRQKERMGEKGVVVLESALIVDLKLFDIVDHVWVVIADKEIAVQRLCQSRGLSPQQAEDRISSQLSNEARVRHAHEVILNNDGVEKVEDQVAKAWQRLWDGAQTAHSS